MMTMFPYLNISKARLNVNGTELDAAYTLKATWTEAVLRTKLPAMAYVIARVKAVYPGTPSVEDIASNYPITVGTVLTPFAYSALLL